MRQLEYWFRPANPDALACGLQRVLIDDSLRSQLSENAARDVRARFTASRQVEAYLAWYDQILKEAAFRPFAPDSEVKYALPVNE